jgi:hypothetical protein
VTTKLEDKARDLLRETPIADLPAAIDRLAADHAERVARKTASLFNIEMEDSAGVMFDQKRKDKIVEDALNAVDLAS